MEKIDPRDRWLVQQFGEEGARFSATNGCMHPEIAEKIERTAASTSKARPAEDNDNPADSQAA